MDACAEGLSALPEEAEEEDDNSCFCLPSEDEPTEASTPGDIPVEEEGTSLCYLTLGAHAQRGLL